MKTNILTLVITLVIGIILAGSLLAPVISDAQKTIGPEVTLTNDSDIVLREIEDGDVFKLTSTVVSGSKTDVWTINDAPIAGINGSALGWNVGLISDAMYVQVMASGNPSSGSVLMMDSTTGEKQYISRATTDGTYVWSWTFSDGELTYIDRYGTTVTAQYTWGYVACPFEEGEYYSAEASGSGVCKSVNDLILCGAYTTGALDTAYAYYNGQTYAANTDYTMSVDAQTELHAGTTDIYDITVSVNMTDGTNTETFTPFRIFLPYEVTGHEAGGASYALVGAIPIMVIVALLMVAVGAIAYRRAD